MEFRGLSEEDSISYQYFVSAPRSLNMAFADHDIPDLGDYTPADFGLYTNRLRCNRDEICGAAVDMAEPGSKDFSNGECECEEMGED